MTDTDAKNDNITVESDDKGEIVEENNKDNKDNNKGVVMASARRYSRRSAPLPTPEEFSRYGEVLPDAPERILSMAEREQDIRHESYRAVVKNDRLKTWGSIIVSLALIIASVLIAHIGYPWVALPLGLSGIIGMILRWIFSRQDSGTE